MHVISRTVTVSSIHCFFYSMLHEAYYLLVIGTIDEHDMCRIELAITVHIMCPYCRKHPPSSSFCTRLKRNAVRVHLHWGTVADTSLFPGPPHFCCLVCGHSFRRHFSASVNYTGWIQTEEQTGEAWEQHLFCKLWRLNFASVFSELELPVCMK